MLDHLAKAIAASNKGKPTYIFQFSDSSFWGVNKYKVKTQRAAMRQTTTAHCPPDATPIKLRS